jgi:hypothetical protein
MAEQAETEAIPALWEPVGAAAQEEEVPMPEQAVRVEQRKHPEAMGATVGMDLI